MVTAVATGYGSIDLIIPGVHKANGLRILQQRWGIEDHEVVAFGDSGNDIEMLQHAGFGFAMANAGKTSKPSPAIRRRITTKKVSCRLLIRCWIAKRRSPDKTGCERIRVENNYPCCELPTLLSFRK